MCHAAAMLDRFLHAVACCLEAAVLGWAMVLWKYKDGPSLSKSASHHTAHLRDETHERSRATALSWAVAIWLGQQPLPEILLRLFRLPGTFGGVVSSLGFALSSGIWAVTTHLGARSPSNPGAV